MGARGGSWWWERGIERGGRLPRNIVRGHVSKEQVTWRQKCNAKVE